MGSKPWNVKGEGWKEEIPIGYTRARSRRFSTYRPQNQSFAAQLRAIQKKSRIFARQTVHAEPDTKCRARWTCLLLQQKKNKNNK